VFPNISFFVVPLQQSSAFLKFGFYVLTKFLLTILHVTMSSFLIRKRGCALVCILEIMQLTIFTETTALILAKDVFSYSHMCVLYIHVSDLNMCDSALFRERRKFLICMNWLHFNFIHKLPFVYLIMFQIYYFALRCHMYFWKVNYIMLFLPLLNRLLD
jgi:hypothetical protein